MSSGVALAVETDTQWLALAAHLGSPAWATDAEYDDGGSTGHARRDR